ncbi:MAG TPA: hypothetical protein VFQ78_09325 [Candidatus Udaeobacter sp.]|nr:hypothetical protein [Candidatus Udaeobacter sp.]
MIGVIILVSANALDADENGLFFDSSQLSSELDEIAKNQAKSTTRFELKVFRDEQLKTPVPANSDISVSVVPLVPAGKHKDAELEQINPAKVGDAKKGCTAEYDKTSGKVFVTLRRPYVFQDMRDATSSRTWAYRIDVKLTTVGRTVGVGGGVQGDSTRECLSFFGILSQKEGKTWKPRKNDHYRYDPELKPKDWETLGTFNVNTIFQNEAKAVFQWKPGSEGKSVSVRWHITGDDKDTFEDVWTDWLTQNNPCGSSMDGSNIESQQTPNPDATPHEIINNQSPAPTPHALYTSPPDISAQNQGLSETTVNPQSPVPAINASGTSVPNVSKEALLTRANRSNRVVKKVYNALIARVANARREHLKRQQDDWLKMRTAEAGDEELLAQGLNTDPDVLRRFAEMNEARTIVLRSMLRGQ